MSARLMIILGVAGLLLLIVVQVASGQTRMSTDGTAPAIGTPVPAGAVGQQLGWVLETVANGATELTEDEVTVRFAPAFLEMVPPAQVVASTQQFAAAYGPLEVVGLARPATDTQALMIVRAKTGNELLVVLAVERDDPHRITNLAFVPAPAGLVAAMTSENAISGLYDIGGRQLYLSCMGPAAEAGGPTVILEAGHGNDSTIWLTVQAALAAETRVCAYDRANTPGGASDPAPTPRDAEDVVADLHALLDVANVPGPYVLAGHSLGGLFVRLYASTYPDEVGGLILVDSSHEEQNARLEGLVGPELWAQYESLTGGFVDVEGFDLDAIFSQVRTARVEAPLPEMPLVVLSHGLPMDDASLLPAGWPIEEDERLWRELHVDLAGLVPGGRLIVAEESGHFIQLDQPELIVSAVRDVVSAL